MSDYRELHDRIDAGEVLLLDGAVGTELQALGVSIGVGAWAGTAQHTHPDTVRFMHERYIRAGVDIVTTNTYSTARHCLERTGLGELTRELNLRAVVLAEEARARAANGRPVFIAGSVSNYGILTGGEVLPERLEEGWSAFDEDTYRANLHEQARILAESGVDLLLAESTGATEHRHWVVEACQATGLPVWPGFKAHVAEDGTLCTGHTSHEPFADGPRRHPAARRRRSCRYSIPTVDATGEVSARAQGEVAGTDRGVSGRGSRRLRQPARRREGQEPGHARGLRRPCAPVGGAGRADCRWLLRFRRGVHRTASRSASQTAVR